MKPGATNSSSWTVPCSQLQNDILVKEDPNFWNMLKAGRMTLYLHCLRNTKVVSPQRREITDTSKL